MKHIYLTAVLVLCLVRYSTAQYYKQYFDGADTVFANSVNVALDTSNTNIWQIGKPQKIIFDSSATLPHAIVTDSINNYPINNTSRFTIKIRTKYPSWGVFALRWKQKLDMDASYDGGIVEFTTNKGMTWQNAFNNPLVYNFYGFQAANKDTLNTGEYAFSGTDSTWRDVWLCFDLSWMNQFPDTIMFRYTLKSDSVDNEKEGWLIDNFMAHITFVHTIKEVEQEHYLTVFPNPANNIVHIQAQKIMDYHIIEKMELVDQVGRVVDRWTNIPTKYWIDTSIYEDGLYLLKIKTNIKTETLPLVIRNY